MHRSLRIEHPLIEPAYAGAHHRPADFAFGWNFVRDRNAAAACHAGVRASRGRVVYRDLDFEHRFSAGWTGVYSFRASILSGLAPVSTVGGGTAVAEEELIWPHATSLPFWARLPAEKKPGVIQVSCSPRLGIFRHCQSDRAGTGSDARYFSISVALELGPDSLFWRRMDSYICRFSFAGTLLSHSYRTAQEG